MRAQYKKWTEGQKQHLVDCLVPHRDLLLGRFSGAGGSNEKKLKVWDDVYEELVNIGAPVPSSSKELRDNVWYGMKRATKKKIDNNNQTGASPMKMSDLDYTVQWLMGGEDAASLNPVSVKDSGVNLSVEDKENPLKRKRESEGDSNMKRLAASQTQDEASNKEVEDGGDSDGNESSHELDQIDDGNTSTVLPLKSRKGIVFAKKSKPDQATTSGSSLSIAVNKRVGNDSSTQIELKKKKNDGKVCKTCGTKVDRDAFNERCYNVLGLKERVLALKERNFELRNQKLEKELAKMEKEESKENTDKST